MRDILYKFYTGLIYTIFNLTGCAMGYIAVKVFLTIPNLKGWGAICGLCISLLSAAVCLFAITLTGHYLYPQTRRAQNV